MFSFDRDPLTRGPTIEVAHEALLREWSRLRGWLDEARDDIRLQRQLAGAAQEWREGGQDASFLLRGSRLQQFEIWREDTRIELTQEEREYLSASLAEREREEAEEAARQEREARLEKRSRTVLRALVGVFAIATVAALILTNFAFDQRDAADQSANEAATSAAEESAQRVIAVTARAEAEQSAQEEAAQRVLAEEESLARATAQAEAEAAEQNALEQASIGLAGQAMAELEGENPERVVLLALEAMENYPYTWQAERALSHIVHQNTLRGLFTGHDDTVQDVAWSPDGTRFATGSGDGSAIIWDRQTGKMLMALKGHEAFDPDTLLQAGVQELTWSPDGSLVASAGGKDNTARVWDAGTGEELMLFDRHADWIWSIDWSPDGTSVVTSSKDGTAMVWDAMTGEVSLVLEGHTDWIRMVRWSPDGSQIATASEDGAIRIWDAESSDSPQVLEDHTGPVWSVAWSGDGGRIASSSADGTAKIWDISSEEVLLSLAHSGTVWRAAWSPDSTQVLTTSEEGKTVLWDVASGQRVSSFSGYTSGEFDAAWSPDGQQVLTTSGFRVHLWDVTSDRLVLSGIHTEQVVNVSWSPDGLLVATASDDHTIGIWDVQTGEHIRTLIGHTNWLQSLAWSPDSSQLASCGWDNTVRIWDVSMGENIFTFTGHDGDPEGYYIPTNAVMGVLWSPDGKSIASDGVSGWLRLWDPQTGEEQWSVQTNDKMGTPVEFSPDGSKLLTCIYPEFPQVWDASTGEAVFGGYTDLQWDFTTGEIPPWCMSGDWSPTGDRFVTAGWDLQAIVWDASTYERLVTFTNHTDGVNDVKWSPVGDRIASSDEEGIVKVWDASTGAELLSFRANPDKGFRLAWSPDGRHLVIADGGNLTATIWRVWPTLEDLIEYAYDCCVLRELTPEERIQFGLAVGE
jgi:WD40 repeat protein